MCVQRPAISLPTLARSSFIFLSFWRLNWHFGFAFLIFFLNSGLLFHHPLLTALIPFWLILLKFLFSYSKREYDDNSSGIVLSLIQWPLFNVSSPGPSSDSSPLYSNLQYFSLNLSRLLQNYTQTYNHRSSSSTPPHPTPQKHPLVLSIQNSINKINVSKKVRYMNLLILIIPSKDVSNLSSFLPNSFFHYNIFRLCYYMTSSLDLLLAFFLSPNCLSLCYQSSFLFSYNKGQNI